MKGFQVIDVDGYQLQADTSRTPTIDLTLDSDDDNIPRGPRPVPGQGMMVSICWHPRSWLRANEMADKNYGTGSRATASQSPLQSKRKRVGAGTFVVWPPAGPSRGNVIELHDSEEERLAPYKVRDVGNVSCLFKASSLMTEIKTRWRCRLL
jgi:hypothetical protein